MRLRITSGELGGRMIATLPSLRPTTDKVRKAVFDILGERIVGASFLDLFAGSGAMGIEAISRGADRAVFIDKDIHHYNLIKKNVNDLKITDQCAVRMMSVENFLAANAYPYDIVFADPWYDELPDISAWHTLLETNGILVLSHSSRQTSPESPYLRIINHKKYGDTSLAFYALQPAA